MVRATTPGGYVLTPYADADEPQVLRLMEAALGPGPAGGRSATLWRWKHLENPFGPSYTSLARTPDGEVVGLRTFMRWGFAYKGHTLHAVRAVDTATHPAHQRRGIFTALTQHVLQHAWHSGVDLVFNTPNRSSLPGYLKMGWHEVGRLQPLVRVLDWRRFAWGLARARARRRHAARAPAGPLFKAEPSSVAGVLARLDVEHLLRRAAATVPSTGIATRRSREYLEWRYARHPAIPYYAVTHGQGDAADVLAVVRGNVRLGLRELMLDELLLAYPAVQPAREVLDELAHRARADYIVALVAPSSAHWQVLRRCGFWPAPRVGMLLTARALRDGLPVDPYLRASWALGLGDVEFF